MTQLRDRRGPGQVERSNLTRIYEPRTPRVLAENVAIAFMAGLATGFVFCAALL